MRSHSRSSSGPKGEKNTTQPHRLRLPLRDSQQEPPVRLCPRCGAEQYHWDPAGSWGGCRLCLPCLVQLETEEENEER